MGARLSALVLVVSLATAAPANAQRATPGVELVGERGVLDARKLDELIALELGEGATRVSHVTIEVHRGRADVDLRLGDEHRRSSVAVAVTEPERALALFVSELARGIAPASPSPPAPPPPPSAPSAPASQSAPASPSAPASAPALWRFSLLGTLGVRVVTDGGARLVTPRLEVGARRAERLRLGVTARYGYASADDALGTVAAHTLSGGVAATYVLATGGSLALGTGPRAEIGWLSGSGRGANGTSTSGAGGSASWELELHVRAGPLSLVGALEAGALFHGLELHADQRDVLHLNGPFLGAALGALL